MKNAGYRDEDDETSKKRSTPPRTKNGCIDWDDMVGFGENENGETTVHVNGVTRPDDLKGPQDWTWGRTRDGDRFAPFKPESDLGSEFGELALPVPSYPSPSRKKGKRSR